MSAVEARVLRAVSRRRQFVWSEPTAFEKGAESTERYLRRLGPRLNYKDAKVLDVGCGQGRTCLHLAETGAKQVLGVDIDPACITFASSARDERFPHLADRVSFCAVRDIDDVGERNFELIVSQDTFTHIVDPEHHLAGLIERLAPGGQLAIGFGPLWRAPNGGHVGHLTRFPWAHLLFSESAIMAMRRQFHAEAHPAETWAEFGLNKMTLKRFLNMMDRPELEPVEIRVNVHEKKLRAVTFQALRRLPLIGELFAFNVYGIWRRVPSAA